MSSVNTSVRWERMILYVILFLGVMLPLIFHIGWKTDVSPHVQMVHDLVENTPAGSTVLISFDYEPSTMPELKPMALSLVDHAWQRGHKVIAVALWPMGVQMANDVFQELTALPVTDIAADQSSGETKTSVASDSTKVALSGVENAPDSTIARHTDKKYGIDYVNLGFKPGGMVTIKAMGRSIHETFPADAFGTPVGSLPIMDDIVRLRDLGYVMSLSAGDPGLKQWIMVAHDNFKVLVSGGTTAVSAPGFLPYINNRDQLRGVMGGLKGAAEYEKLRGVFGPASIKMDSQSIAHVIILIFIAIGNIKAYRRRKAQRRKSEKA
ncbi:MAG: hypothetical protein FJ042_03345 [Candidatus Cloacimonetes bacterium]|nr:hypothetical protein [Candidatus Cloacimonadota bacterium]